MTLSTTNRTYAAAHFQLELGDEKNCGVIKSIEGGSVKVDVMQYQQGGNYDRLRQLGKPKFEDIKLMMGMSASPTFYNWIAQFFTGNQDRRNGAVVAGDFYYSERARREFQFALLKEVTFPGLDATSKEALYMAVTIAVESIAFKPGNTSNKLRSQIDMPKQQIWKASDFKFTLGGYRTEEVTKIDPITIKQQIIEYHAGGMRAPTKTPSQIDYPQVAFYIPEAHASQYIDRFMKNGGAIKPEAPNRMTDGAIHYCGSDGKELGRLNLHNTEIVGVTPDKSDATSENTKTVKVELFCESMNWEFKG